MADSAPLISRSSHEEEVGKRRGRKKICGCTTLKDEFKGSYFDLIEQQGSQDGRDARTLIASTFSPKPHVPYIAAKLIILVWMISVMAMSISGNKFPSFWLAFLTHWTLVLTVAYSLMSFVASVVLACRPPPTLSIWLKVMWALYAAMLPANVLVTILYWALEFDPSTFQPYLGIMLHGGTMILIMIDGCILSRIPLRIKQFWFYELFCFIYIIWTIIHSFSSIGNPFNESRGEDDNSIYPQLDWKDNTTTAIITSVLVLFVGNPIIFLLCRLLSRDFRRYEDSAPKSLNDYVDERV